MISPCFVQLTKKLLINPHHIETIRRSDNGQYSMQISGDFWDISEANFRLLKEYIYIQNEKTEKEIEAKPDVEKYSFPKRKVDIPTAKSESKDNHQRLSVLTKYYKLTKAIENLFGPDAIQAMSDINDELDDHTSVWGGAGPDCINMRLATAINALN